MGLAGTRTATVLRLPSALPGYAARGLHDEGKGPRQIALEDAELHIIHTRILRNIAQSVADDGEFIVTFAADGFETLYRFLARQRTAEGIDAVSRIDDYTVAAQYPGDTRHIPGVRVFRI